MIIHPLWFICLFVRMLLIYIIWYIYNKNSDIKYKYEIQISSLVILFIMGSGFIIKGYLGSNNEIQINKVFWHETRFVHGSLYLLSCMYLLFDNLNITLLILSLDLIFSILYRFIFKK